MKSVGQGKNTGPSAPKRILIVDDERISRDVLVQLLQIAGYEVLTAETGERALLTLRERGPAIGWLFTAVALPGLADGWMLGDEFHRHHPSRPIVYASANEADLRRQGSGTVVVRRPIAPVEVFATIKSLAETGAPEAPAADLASKAA